MDVFIGVGANVEPEKNIEKALLLLMEKEKVVASSRFYRTAALGEDGLPSGQPAYLNGVIKIQTERSIEQLIENVLRPVEAMLGRVRGVDKFAARPVDLDVLLFGQWVGNVNGKQIPDEDIFTRPFVAIPLMELTGKATIPGKTPGRGRALHSVVDTFDGTTMEPAESFSVRLAGLLTC